MQNVKKLRDAFRHGRSHITLPFVHILLGHEPGLDFIVSYPRSGSTWLRTILCNLLVPEAQGDPRIISTRIPGVSLCRLGLDRKAKRYDPAIIHSHRKYRKGFNKVLYLVRDGRDSVISLYHYTTTRYGESVSFKEWFDLYKAGVYGTRWHAHVESWLKQGKNDLKENLLVIRFEDLKKDTVSCIKQIVAFFGLSIPPHMILQAIDNATIEKAKAWEKRFLGEPKSADASLCRGGQSGQWKDCFPPTELQAFIDMSEHALRLAGYRP